MKKYFSVAILIITVFVLSGCSGGYPLSVHNDFKLKEKTQTIYLPKLNQVSKVEIGQNIFSKHYVTLTSQYDVFLNGIAKGQNGSIYVNSSFDKKTSAQDSLHYSDSDSKKLRKLEKVNALCYTSWICLTDLNADGVFTHFSAFGKSDYGKLDNPVSYELKQAIRYTEDSFKYVVLYQGKKGNTIKISFREFKKDFARPAFTQDIEYELEKDKPTIIGFKGLRIEVLEATNLDIKYKVIKDYN